MRLLRTLLLGATRGATCPGADSSNCLALRFEHFVNGEPLRLDSLRYRTTGQELFSVTRLSYLASGFALQRADGTWLDLPNQVLWIDAERRRLDGELAGVLPGRYTTLRFDLGLKPDLNHADPASFGPAAALNPNLNSLHWNWQGGYIFLALEGQFRTRPNERVRLSFARDTNRPDDCRCSWISRPNPRRCSI